MSHSLSKRISARAMRPPKESVVVINSSIIRKAIKASRRSKRGRIVFPFHKTEADPLQRMLNILQPLSYIQPHRHISRAKAESVIVLKGSICYVTFKDNGKLKDHFILAANYYNIGVDTSPEIFHTFFALEKDTVVFEVKTGPYEEKSDKDFAKWAPREGSRKARRYLQDLYDIVMGS